MSLLDSLGIGMRGLHAAQINIDVTGQNISNANTEGYSRKKVDQQADALANEVFGQKGLGVDVTSIVRIRDQFLDRQIWEQTGGKGMLTELKGAMDRLENILQEPSENGLGAQIDKFWNTWQDLANNPANLSAREAVKASANVMIDTFHSVFKQIEDFGLSMNSPLINQAKKFNNLAQEIYHLNQQVAEVEANPKQKANDTRDLRDRKVLELASMIDVQTIEDKQGRVIITSGGSLIVGASEAQQLETYGIDKTLSDGSTSSELRLRFVDSRKAFEPRSGSLKGIMDARGEVLTEYMNDLNDLAEGLVKNVNGAHLTGYNLNKNTGVYFFNPENITAGNMSMSAAVLGSSANIAAAAGGRIVNVSSLAYTLPSTMPTLPAAPAVISGTFDMALAKPTLPALQAGMVKVTMASSGAVLVEGTDYTVNYATKVITFPNIGGPNYDRGNAFTVEVKPAIPTPAGGSSASLDLTSIDTSFKNVAAGTVKILLPNGLELQEGAGKDYVVDYEAGVITFLQIGNGKYAAGDIISGQIQFNTSGFPGNGNGQNALQIAQLRQKPTMQSAGADGGFTQSLNDFYSAMIGKLGIQKNENDSNLQTKEFLVAQMNDEQASISGVSLDEEMANMIKFENSYKASAKYISTINSMLDVLMNI